MSQRESGYERRERDLYETPQWVTAALLPHIPRAMQIWEPAAGSNKMADILALAGHKVFATDIVDGPQHDFLSMRDNRWQAIVTNPPYSLADMFIAHALMMMHERRGLVAMLLRTDFDHAGGRRRIFADHKAFAKKLVLTKRIVWFERTDGQRASPSFNHAWFIWNWRHEGPPAIAYGP